MIDALPNIVTLLYIFITVQIRQCDNLAIPKNCHVTNKPDRLELAAGLN